jgi:hypothetical protein
MSKLLTFETDSETKHLEIHLNKEGARYLIDNLNRLYENNKNDHTHMMSSDWGGDELSDEKQNNSSMIFNHVKIIFWEE